MTVLPLREIESPEALRRRIEAMALPRNFAACLEAGARLHGERPAWHFFEEEGPWARLSHAALCAVVFRLADGLGRFGIGPGAHVLVQSNNRPEFPLVWLALGCLGAVMVPANIKYTVREVAYLAGDAEATHAIVEAPFLPLLREAAPALAEPGRLVVIGEAPAGTAALRALYESGDPRARPGLALPPDTLVNIQYTSGTTGFPKGCLLTHDYWLVLSLVSAAQTGMPLRNVLIAQHFYYMDPQWLLLMALLVGGTAFIATRPSVRRFMPWVREHRIHYCILFEPIYKAPPDPLDGANELMLVNIFGFTPKSHGDLERRFAVRAREAFGMTEIGAALYVPVDRADLVGSGSCGLPVPFREAKVMADLQREAAPGEQGELWVRGRSLMQGYWRRPDANAELFRDGWFRTGDRFLRDAAGLFYYQGRAKDMIRRNAENIAAREVETVLREMPAVAEAAVVAVPDALKGEEVKAYIQLREGHTPEEVPPEALLEHCRQRLARFKIPRYWAYVESFPMTVSDRVEKKQLVAGVADLSAGSFDSDEGRWR